MSDGIEKRTLEKTIDLFSSAFKNKRNRSTLFLILSFLMILALNGALPLIEGSTHFTAEPIEMTYGTYRALEETDPRHRITWSSEEKILLYKIQYAVSHPEIPLEDAYKIAVPDDFVVKVFTKFFFEHAFWYISTVTSLVSVVLLFYTLFNFFLIRAKERDPLYLKALAEVDFMISNTLEPDKFEPWMDNVFNRERKIAQHRANVSYKIEKLYNGTDYKIRQLAKAMRANTPLSIPAKTEKRIKRYLVKLDQLEDQLKQDYIDEHVIPGRVKYFKAIHPMFVYSGVNESGVAVDNYSLIKTDSQKITGDAFLKVILILATTLIFAVMFTVTAVASLEQSIFWTLVNMGAKIIPLLFQVPASLDYTNSFMEHQVLSNTLARKAIGLRHLASVKKVD